MRLATTVTIGVSGLLLLAACSRANDGPATAKPAAAQAAKPAAKAGVLPWIEDDYDAALARARAAKLPLFIEVWAPW